MSPASGPDAAADQAIVDGTDVAEAERDRAGP
jgi:hypothetical protein